MLPIQSLLAALTAASGVPSPLPSTPIAGPAIPFGQAQAPAPPPMPMAPQKPGIDWAGAIGPLATLALAATGHNNAALGAGRGSMLADESRRREEAQQQAFQIQQEHILAQQQQQAAAEEAKRQAAVADLLMKAGPALAGAKTKADYDAGVNLYEGIGARYGIRPNSIRQAMPYRAPNSNEIMAAAAANFLKNPANKEAIEQGQLDGSVMLDIQGDGVPKEVPVREMLMAGGVQFDPVTKKPLVIPKKAGSTNVQLDDQVYLGEVAKFEADKGRPATDQEKGEIASRVIKTIADQRRAPASSGGDDPLKAFQSFTAGEKLAADWKAANGSVREMNRQFQLMQTGLKRAKEGDMMGGSQAVLVTFQKILDPNSVVRESEYARTAAGLSMINRIEGYAEKLRKGGAGVPIPELAAMVETAKQFLSGMQNVTAGTRKRISAVATRYKIDPALIFDDTGEPDAAPAASGKIIVKGRDGRSYSFATQEQADAFKRADSGGK